MNKTAYFILLAIILLIAGIFILQSQYKIPAVIPKAPESSKYQSNTQTTFASPVNNPLARILKKPFGIYVSPDNSPVMPEKFTGYHTGVDFETFPNEQNEDVPVMAICNGKILEKRFGRGVGGMIVQSCVFYDAAITIEYGHLKLSSVTASVGEILKAGAFLGVLGRGYSTETDGERKHLHLAIHKGSTINTRGYVQTKDELTNWIDIEKYLTQSAR